MKLSMVSFAVLVLCAVSYAAEYGPLMTALQPREQPHEHQLYLVEQPQHGRQKRSLLLGGALLGAGALGLGAAALGAGALGAGAIGAGVIGAKAGFIGGALAARSFGGYGRSYGGGYGGGYGGYYGHPVYYEEAPIYRSYPAYYVEDDCW